MDEEMFAVKLNLPYVEVETKNLSLEKPFENYKVKGKFQSKLQLMKYLGFELIRTKVIKIMLQTQAQTCHMMTTIWVFPNNNYFQSWPPHQFSTGFTIFFFILSDRKQRTARCYHVLRTPLLDNLDRFRTSEVDWSKVSHWLACLLSSL